MRRQFCSYTASRFRSVGLLRLNRTSFATKTTFSKEQKDAWSWPIRPHVDWDDITARSEEHIRNVEHRRMNHLLDVATVIANYKEFAQHQAKLNSVRHVRKSIADIINFSRNVPNEPKNVDIVAEMKRELKLFLEEQFTSNDFNQFVSLQRTATLVLDSNLNLEAWSEIGKLLKDESTAYEIKLRELADVVNQEGTKIPNLSHASVPVGEEPTLLRYFGEKHGLSSIHQLAAQIVPSKEVKRSKFLDHVEICEKLDLVDFESAQLCSGNKFYYLKNELVLLELALIQYALSKLISKGFTPISVPEMVRKQVVEGCGFQPRGEHSQVYNVDEGDLCMVGTSEMSLAGMHANKVLPIDMFPQKLIGVSHCFRKEAGSHSQFRGLYRVHQFTKVEMFLYALPNESEKLLDDVVQIQQEIFSELGFHAQVLNMPSHDLGTPAYQKIDIEAFMPGRGSYGEVSSASNCTDFQSRRLFIRYRDPKTRKNDYLHTLNGTAVATPRAMITIIEQNQYETEDGRLGFLIPKVLHPYMHGITHVEQKSK